MIDIGDAYNAAFEPAISSMPSVSRSPHPGHVDNAWSMQDTAFSISGTKSDANSTRISVRSPLRLVK